MLNTTSNLRIITIVVAVVMFAAAIGGASAFLDNDDESSIDATTYQATFEPYNDSAHPSTVVKYTLNGKDVTGTTQVLSGDTKVHVVATSNEKIYGLALNTIPIFKADVNEEHVDTVPDSLNTYSYSIDGTVFSMFGDVTVTVSPYYVSLNDWPSATTYTTLKIQSGLTCTIDGEQVNDGDVIQVKGSNTVNIVVTSNHQCTIMWNAEWDDGSTNFGGHDKVSQVTIEMFCSATFNDISGTMNINFRG